jgi:hypothetical protein
VFLAIAKWGNNSDAGFVPENLGVDLISARVAGDCADVHVIGRKR